MIHSASKQGFAQQGRIGVSSMASYSFKSLKKFSGCNGLLCSSMTDCKVLVGQPCTPPDGLACEAAHHFGQVYTPAPALSTQEAADRFLAIAVDDWDLLFRAVETSLRAAVGVSENTGQHSCAVTARSATESASAPDADSLKVKTTVLECVTVLDFLHRALACERRQRPQGPMISM